MHIFADTSAWMPNYRFAYIAVWAGLVFCLIGLVFLFLLPVSRFRLASVPSWPSIACL